MNGNSRDSKRHNPRLEEAWRVGSGRGRVVTWRPARPTRPLPNHSADQPTSARSNGLPDRNCEAIDVRGSPRRLDRPAIRFQSCQAAFGRDGGHRPQAQVLHSSVEHAPFGARRCSRRIRRSDTRRVRKQEECDASGPESRTPQRALRQRPEGVPERRLLRYGDHAQLLCDARVALHVPAALNRQGRAFYTSFLKLKTKEA